MLTTAMPEKKTTNDNVSLRETLPTRNRQYPTTRLSRAQITFRTGEDNPFPGGFANGVGKRFPEMPCTK
jgi:hypothetical protein